MTPEKYLQKIREHADELRRAYADRWPRMMRKEAIEHFRDGFRQGGFIDKELEPWDVTRRQMVPFNGASGRYTPLLSKTGELMSSIDGLTEPGAVRMYSTSSHARYHNEGATIPVTQRMKGFFWAKHKETADRYGKENAEALFWRNMALTKKRELRLPKRRFMSHSEVLMEKIYAAIKKDLRRIINL